MKAKLLMLNHSFLFLCTSIYLGTGWSMILFSFPTAHELTVDNYYTHFVPQVTAATDFFTYMTQVMIAAAIIMIIAEWKSSYRWFPIVVLLGVIVATALTILFIFPYNQSMSAGITDPIKLKEILSEWMFLNKVRVGLWTVQWFSMMGYFALKTMKRAA